jgi:hypothetical protein
MRLISPDAYLMAYKNPKATFECLKAFRTHYPDSMVHLVSDGGDDLTDIAATFRCNYSYRERIGLPPFAQDRMKEWLDRMCDAASRSTAEYMIHLEDDVLVRGEIWRSGDWAIAGPYHGYARLSDALFSFLQKKNSNLKSNIYGGCGGTLLNRRLLLQSANMFQFSDYSLYESLDSHIRWQDVFLTLVFLVAGHEYTSLEDVYCEANDAVYPGWEHNKKPIVHQFKRFYGKTFDAGDLGILHRRQLAELP